MFSAWFIIRAIGKANGAATRFATVRPRIDWPTPLDSSRWNELEAAAREACENKTAEAVIEAFSTAKVAVEWLREGWRYGSNGYKDTSLKEGECNITLLICNNTLITP
eukprot:SAG31_NODE_114_length_24318_cov_16.787481_6_plen_108_part_00